jgi:DNA-binding transcriptional regulator LsrR (DeoR family)
MEHIDEKELRNYKEKIMRTRRIKQIIRDEIAKKYLSTDVSRKELAEEYKYSARTISEIIKEHREKMKIVEIGDEAR